MKAGCLPARRLDSSVACRCARHYICACIVGRRAALLMAREAAASVIAQRPVASRRQLACCEGKYWQHLVIGGLARLRACRRRRSNLCRRAGGIRIALSRRPLAALSRKNRASRKPDRLSGAAQKAGNEKWHRRLWRSAFWREIRSCRDNKGWREGVGGPSLGSSMALMMPHGSVLRGVAAARVIDVVVLMSMPGDGGEQANECSKIGRRGIGVSVDGDWVATMMGRRSYK